MNITEFNSRRSNVFANNGLVATSQPLAAQAGVSILQDGGNAFDAAVATAAALNVVEPTSTGLGGDVFALYRTADGDVGAMRSCGGAPQNATIGKVCSILNTNDDSESHHPDFGDSTSDLMTNPDDLEMPFRGPLTVTVPGTAGGWEATVERFGHKSLPTVLEPAIEYAMNGYPVSEVVAMQWEEAQTLFTNKNARDTYLFNNNTPIPGQTIQLPKLGKSLQKIAQNGADVVYNGEIADAIVTEVQSNGGLLTREDLAAFEPEFVDPISTTYNGAKIYQLPPNNQGAIVLEALNIAEEIDTSSYPLHSPEQIHYLVESLKLAFVDGHKYITDPQYETIPPLHSKNYARKRAKNITQQAIQNPQVGIPNSHAEDADTVLLTVADTEGNVVCYINSRFAGFGSGIVAGETGIALQNRGASFSLDSNHPNRLEPGKRPFHTLIPAIVRFGPSDWGAFGVMGGFMQPQGQVQILSSIIDYDLMPQAALDLPRWRYREDGTLAVEERLQNLTPLVKKGHDVRVLPASKFGGAQFVRQTGETIVGASEPRKDGLTIGY